MEKVSYTGHTSYGYMQMSQVLGQVAVAYAIRQSILIQIKIGCFKKYICYNNLKLIDKIFVNNIGGF